MSRRNLLLVWASFAALALGFLSSSIVSSRQASGPWRPFTAVLAEQRFSADGKLQTHEWPDVEYTLFARRTDGSRLIAFNRRDPKGNWMMLRRILDLAAEKEFTVDPMTESVTTYPLPTANVESYRSKPGSCTQELDPDVGRIAGYDVVKVNRQIPGPDGSDEELWMAPSLDCFTIRKRSDFPGGFRNDRQAIFVIEGEPTADLFKIPTSYVERSPSQVFAEFARRFPGHRAGPDQTAKILDGVYESTQH